MTVRHQKRYNIAWYITPHGFGHAVRSLEVIHHLLQMDPKPNIIIVSDLPQFLIEQNLGCSPAVRRKRIDIGLVQKDNLRYDLDATRTALETLHDSHAALIREEAMFLKDSKVDGIVSDIGFLPFYAALEAGLPALGCSNFTWDWIYESLAGSDRRWHDLIDWCRGGYALCDLLLRLPMHGDCSSCLRIEDIPLVARRSNRKREEIRDLLGCKTGQDAYLVSFTELDLGVRARDRIGQIKDAVFFYKRPLKLDVAGARSVDGMDLAYVDVVAAVDAVITKPGYGIVSDCLANGVPLIYSDRGAFPEYEILVREMESQLTAVYMSSSELYEGNWEPFMKRMRALPRRIPNLRTDGGRVCAERIMRWLFQKDG